MVTVLYGLSVWVHILAASFWIGGMAFLVFVIVPLLKKPELGAVASAFVQSSGERFRVLGWICLGTLVLTGSLNMWFRGIAWSSFFDGSFQESPMARTLAMKLLLVALVLLLSAVHDFRVGPRATALWQKDPKSEAATRARKKAALYGRVNGTLSLLIALLAVFLARGGLPF